MRIVFILLFFSFSSITATRSRRQLSIDDIISGALSLVRPIFDTSKPIQNESMLRKPDAPTQENMRDTSILGSYSQTALDDVPFCKGNSGICRFISCSAENFKKDPTFGNIQLAAQVLGDAKLRKTISSNPEAVTAVCKEQGLDDSQCKLFSKGFQLIDKFITTIEKKREPEKPMTNEEATTQVTEADTTLKTPILNDAVILNKEYSKNWGEYSDEINQPIKNEIGNTGSKTWSSNSFSEFNTREEQPNVFVASWTPIPLFSLPTIPPSPPLAFKTVPSLIISPIQTPKLKDGIFFPVKEFNFNKNNLFSFKRTKRSDYYDQVDTNEDVADQVDKTTDNDYYGSLDEKTVPKNNEKTGLKQCMDLLGIGV